MTVSLFGRLKTSLVLRGDYGVHWKLTLQRGLESWTSDTSNSANNSHTSDAWARPRGQETVTCPVGNLQLRIRRVPFVKTFFGDISAGGTFGAGRAQGCLFSRRQWSD